MRRSLYIIIGIVTSLLFTSCGQQADAERLAKDFIEQNADAPEKFSSKHFADLGTTRHLNDSIIQMMRNRGAEHYKKGISYSDIPDGDLFYLRMRYVYEGDTLQNTFYLDGELTKVVAFK